MADADAHRGGAQAQVLVDSAGQVPHPGVEDRELLIRDALDEVAIVADDEQRAGPGVEEILHRGEHVGVEVVGGLVEDEHVRLVEQDQQQLQPTALSSAELAHPGRELRRGESEPLEQLAGRQLRVAGAVAGPLLGDDVRDPGVLPLLQADQALIEDADLDRRPGLHPAGGRRDRARHQPEQGRLARRRSPPGCRCARRARSATRRRAAPAGRRSSRSRRARPRRPCPAGRRRASRARPSRAAAARSRSARPRHPSGTSACWCGPGRRGAARRAPCASGCGDAPRMPRPSDPVPPAAGRTRRTRRRTAR